MPERQGMEYFQKQASPMDKIQCGLLILSTHVHKDVILNGIQADFLSSILKDLSLNIVLNLHAGSEGKNTSEGSASTSADLQDLSMCTLLLLGGVIPTTFPLKHFVCL